MIALPNAIGLGHGGHRQAMELKATSDTSKPSDGPGISPECLAHHEQIRARVKAVVGHGPIVEVARRLGMNSETTRRMLGKSPPSFSFIVAVCRAYGVSADWLLFGVHTPEHTRQARAYLFTAPVGELSEALFRRLRRAPSKPARRDRSRAADESAVGGVSNDGGAREVAAIEAVEAVPVVEGVQDAACVVNSVVTTLGARSAG